MNHLTSTPRSCWLVEYVSVISGVFLCVKMSGVFMCKNEWCFYVKMSGVFLCVKLFVFMCKNEGHVFYV